MKRFQEVLAWLQSNPGASFAEIGRELGISRQRVWEIFGEHASPALRARRVRALAHLEAKRRKLQAGRKQRRTDLRSRRRCPDCHRLFTGWYSRKRCPDCKLAAEKERQRQKAKRIYAERKLK